MSKRKRAVETKGRRVAAIVGVLVVHDGRDAFGMEPVGGTESGHSRSKDDDVWHWNDFSWFSSLLFLPRFSRYLRGFR